ncbi:unnamed protein product [Adineta ricciae]|uniref:Aminoglycoside phosphotransferase domain-containing protein n=1 Tax=Adineta ricciae TaxID=249248 RepID=A0A815R0A5_ADIRI|nr:unnamed protein product [Adineta ricciae]
MPLFETISIDTERVRQLARDHWDVEVGECLKSAQNHTFIANKNDSERFILRVTPDPNNKRLDSTELEVALLDYLHKNQLPVCRAIPSSITSKSVVHFESLILCLFTYATGEPVVYTDWTWMTNKDIVIGLGHWFARLHKLTRCFVQEQPDLAARARHWTTLHDGVLAGVEVDERDKATVTDPTHFGIIHGDVNPSNYFWDPAVMMPCMFDWDQLQQSWFLYDLSAPIWGVVSLERGGSPIDRSPVPQANPQLYTAWLLEGYESEEGIKPVDRDALQRMVMIRRELYRRFCRLALLELPAEHPMAKFCKSVTDFFDKEEKESLAQTE